METAAKKQKTEETVPTEGTPLALRSTGGGDGGLADTSGRTSETAVSIPPTITYGMQDTHTTIHPMCYWFSMVSLDHAIPKLHAVRLNSIYQCISKGVPDINFNTGPWTKKALDGQYTFTAGSPPTITGLYDEFPYQPGSSIYYPWYRDTYSKWYQWWTVLGCEYEITLMCPRGSGRGAVVAHIVETEGTTGARTLSDTMDLYNLQAQKGINYKSIQPYNTPGGYKTTIRGQYKPGTAKRDVKNDGDVKLWTAVGSTPGYQENLKLYFYRDPLSSNESNQAASTRQTHVQVQVRLKYIVQWKDLKQAAYYPYPGASPVTDAVTFPTQAYAG